MGIELKTKQGHITLTAPKSSGGGSVDLSNYYTKAQTDAKIKEAVDNVSVDLTGYATEQYVNDFVGDVAVDITNSINRNLAENYVSKKDFETVTSAFLTDIPDEYLTDSEAEEKYARITDIPDVSEYQTEEQVNTLISNALADIGVAEQGAY